MPKDLLGRELRVGQEIIYLHVVDLQVEEMYGTIYNIFHNWIDVKFDDGYDFFDWKIIISNTVKSANKIIIVKDVPRSLVGVKHNRFDLLDL
jgi:hypothetical protein